MAPDPNLNKYKRMYRHNECDSAVNYALFAEMKECKPDSRKLKQLSQDQQDIEKENLVKLRIFLKIQMMNQVMMRMKHHVKKEKLVQYHRQKLVKNQRKRIGIIRMMIMMMMMMIFK